jgi:hypothetical protein
MRIFLITITMLLCSCTAGLMFNYNKAADLDLYQLKSTEYTDLFGAPLRSTNMTTGDGKYKHVWYYSSSKALSSRVSRRTLFLEFKDDQLNAYVYASSFDIDKTRADLLKVDHISIGTSTKSDVLTLMGKPYGKALCPSLLGDYKDKCTKPKEIWAWIEFDKTTSVWNNDPRGNKSVFVMFDASGKVIDLKAIDNQ